MNRKYLTLVGLLGLGLLCLNLSAATSYPIVITHETEGSDSFLILSNKSGIEGFFGNTHQAVGLTVTQNGSQVTPFKWLTKESLLPMASLMVNAGITFSKDELVRFSNLQTNNDYQVNYVTSVSNGFNADYGVNSYWQLVDGNGGGALDFQFARSAIGEGGGTQGGPLPGVLATLLLGGGSVWALKKRKKAGSVK